jgi:hypothetical protein
MNGRFQMQGGKNWILPKEINQTGSSRTLIGWKSGQTTFAPLWDRMEGAWLWTQERRFFYGGGRTSEDGQRNGEEMETKEGKL